MKDFTTLSEAMNELRKEGYTENLSAKDDFLESGDRKTKLYPDDFEVDHVYRFEGQSNPADMSILYAVSSDKYNLKGLLVNAYGVYSDQLTNKLAKKFS